MSEAYLTEIVQTKIYSIRGHQVMLDTDIAEIYGVETKRINEAVKNNPEKFPDDFYFELNTDEQASLRSKFSTLKKGRGQHRKYPPNSLLSKDFFNTLIEQITREHIISQTPNWTISSQGFNDETDFSNHLHMFGNLTLLSKSDNSRCQNQPTHTKMTDPGLYANSSYAETRQLAHQYGPNAGVFTKADILKRTQAFATVVVGKWAIW